MITAQSKIFKELPAALNLIRQWQAASDVIVFTNGCFDILHLGHVDYLEKARHLGNKLIVGLNTDASMKRLKGSERPLQDEMSRARVVASLLFVDLLILFGEDTPYELIAAIKPDVLVKGDDYDIENIVGHDIVQKNGGSVKTIALVKGYSTTRIIDKIKEQIKK